MQKKTTLKASADSASVAVPVKTPPTPKLKTQLPDGLLVESPKSLFGKTLRTVINQGQIIVEQKIFSSVFLVKLPHDRPSSMSIEFVIE